MTSQHDKAKRCQFDLRHLLAVVSIVAVLFAVIPLPWLGFIWLAAVGSAYGLRFTWQRNRHGAIESVAGGSAGGIAGLLAALTYVYTLLETWEDEGLGFLGCLVMFLPFAVFAGAIIGVLIWFVGTGLREVIIRSRIS